MPLLRINSEELRGFCINVLNQSIPLDEAEVVTNNLVEADLSGFYSHGVCKVADYLKRMEDGLIERETKLSLVKETPTTVVYDANNGWGAYASKIAMEQAIEKAKKSGTAFAAVRNSNHFGITSYYTKMAAEQNCIGFATSNASSLVVPFGSMEPSLGTNPISFAVPRKNGNSPIVLDMSTANTARGKITLANKTGDTIPENWAITIDGEETTDPVKALEGYLLPMGPKGSGLAIMMDIFSGVLSGALFGNHVPRMYEDKKPQNLGHMFGVINIEAFLELNEYEERIEERYRQVAESKPMKGFDRVYSPGEIEQEKTKEQLENGIKMPVDIYDELKAVGFKYGVKISDYINI